MYPAARPSLGSGSGQRVRIPNGACIFQFRHRLQAGIRGYGYDDTGDTKTIEAVRTKESRILGLGLKKQDGYLIKRLFHRAL